MRGRLYQLKEMMASWCRIDKIDCEFKISLDIFIMAWVGNLETILGVYMDYFFHNARLSGTLP